MVKLVALPVLVVLLAMHTPINAFGLVRVDIQKDTSGGVALANAISSAISSKIQSWNSIINSLLQAKLSYGTTVTTTATTSRPVSYSSGAVLAPLYQKVITVNSGVVAAAPVSGQVASRIDDDDHTTSAPAPAAAPAGSVQRITVNKSLLGYPSVSVSNVSSGSALASGSASVAVPNTVGYTYRKRYVAI